MLASLYLRPGDTNIISIKMSTRWEKRDQSLQTFLFCLETFEVLIPLDQQYPWTGDTDAAAGWLLGSTAQHASAVCVLQNLTAPPLFPSNFTDNVFPKLSSYHHISGSRHEFHLLCYGNLVHNRGVFSDTAVQFSSTAGGQKTTVYITELLHHSSSWVWNPLLSNSDTLKMWI